jgi:ferredoxin
MSLNDNSLQSTHQFDPAKMWDVKFIFNGEEKTIPVSEDSSLLESAETIFDDVPFSCRKGICANCAGKVLEGRNNVFLEKEVLEEPHLQAGYICCCQAHVVGPDVVLELGSFNKLFP